MEQPSFNEPPKSKLKKATLSQSILLIATQIMATACSIAPTREETIQAVLRKENALIQKIKEERGHEKIRLEIARCEVLKGPEFHLTESLDEIMNGNEVIINQLTEDTERGRPYEGIHSRNR